MEFEIDEFSGEFWNLLEMEDAPANHPPGWSRDCPALQTGVLIPEEAVQVDLRLVLVD